MIDLDSKIPSGPIDQKWERHKFDMKLVNPANKRKYSVIVVGSGLAGASASATLACLRSTAFASGSLHAPARAVNILDAEYIFSSGIVLAEERPPLHERSSTSRTEIIHRVIKWQAAFSSLALRSSESKPDSTRLHKL